MIYGPQGPVYHTVMFKLNLKIFLVIFCPFSNAQISGFCTSDELEKEFIEKVEVSIIEKTKEGQIIELRAPKILEGVRFRGVTLKRVENKKETLTAGILASEFNDYPNSVISWVTIEEAQTHNYIFRVHYSIEPVYPDGCSYRFDISAKT